MGCHCRNCKKPITAEVSVEIGLGPVCRKNLKVKERGNTAPLFRSKCHVMITGEVIVLTDKNGPVSLTNDMENVLADIRKIGYLGSTDQKIIYRDSLGIYDGVKVKSLNPIQISFYSLNCTDLEKALEKVKTK